MKPVLLLRITSIISLLFAVLHTLGGADSWSPVGETDVLRAMRSYHFDAGGVSRTYLDFYLGLGFSVGVFLLLQAVLLWQLATIAKVDSIRIRPMVVSFIVASLACAFLSWKFIFAAPAIFSAVIAILLGFTFYAAGNEKHAQ
ncbi:MAG: hypothetical protein QOF63_2989 [Thermoanaerobaculia bacterium]|jgi:hypothetical protein|nr:hypothetical protein [Thermoanaerobaculia bacterium]